VTEPAGFYSSCDTLIFRNHQQIETRMYSMAQIDWAKKYAEMDERIVWKYEQLPDGEQIGQRPDASVERPDRK
jgi:hypothetical protein